jgi:hypothetical protein
MRRLAAPAQQPVVKVRLHSNGDASPLHPNAGAALGAPDLAALLLPQIFPIFSVVTPCQAGASSFSVLRRTFTTGCQDGCSSVRTSAHACTSLDSAAKPRPVRYCLREVTAKWTEKRFQS